MRYTAYCHGECAAMHIGQALIGTAEIREGVIEKEDLATIKRFLLVFHRPKTFVQTLEDRDRETREKKRRPN